MTKMRPLVAGGGVCGTGSTLVFGDGGADTVKIAFIDPLSGLMAPVGQNQLKSWQYVAEVANQKNWAGAHKFEVVGFDNKLLPQESLTILKQAVDQNIRYIVQGNGSSVGLALEDAVAKHNERNPGKEIVYLNYAAVDPDMTNSKCNYWHFRLDANSDMKMEALTTFLAKDQNVKKVYLINQNYSFGHQVAARRQGVPEAQAAGHPDRGRGSAPAGAGRRTSRRMSAKIKASGADTVITGNWGKDLAPADQGRQGRRA